MQTDVYSKQAERFMRILRPLLPTGGPADVLSGWDCRYNTDSHGAELFERFYTELVMSVFGATCGVEVVRYLLRETAVIPGLFSDFDRALLDQRSGWFAAGRHEAAFRTAAERALHGPTRPWSDHQRVTFQHLMLGGRRPAWLGFDRGPYPLAGGRATIRQGQIFRQGGHQTTWSPSYRFSTDFAEPAAHTALAGGPSDRRFARWYANEIADWLAGRTKRLAPGKTPRSRLPHRTADEELLDPPARRARAGQRCRGGRSPPLACRNAMSGHPGLLCESRRSRRSTAYLNSGTVHGQLGAAADQGGAVQPG